MIGGVGLGCMRLSTDHDRDEERALATLRAALDAGVVVLDTARAYARDDGELGHNERLVASALMARGSGPPARVITKGGMRRPGGRWVPDGRARTIRSDCEASVAALGGSPIDTYLLHAPDPRVAFATSVRALVELLEEGLVRRIGLSNVNRGQLDAALAMAPIASVEVALGPFAETALRGGVVARCIELGIEVLAHSPLGGPGRAVKLGRHDAVAAVAERHGVTVQRAALAAIADLHPLIVPLAGARRPATAASLGVPVALDAADRALLEQRYGWRAVLSSAAGEQAPTDRGEIVLIMGLQGAGKSSVVESWTERGFVRLNRDARGSTLRALHLAMRDLVASGVRRIVADNTYITRAQRQAAIEAARRCGARLTGLWLDTPVAEAQHNIVLRMLAAHGRLLEPEEMERATDPTRLGPAALFRSIRSVELPTADEGFDSFETVPFVRRSRPGRDRPAIFVHLDAAERGFRADSDGLSLVFGWRPEATPEWVRGREEALGSPVRCCPHAGGPPRCWCRPPLPGLLVAFAEEHGVDLAKSVVIGTKSVHGTLARAVGAAYREL